MVVVIRDTVSVVLEVVGLCIGKERRLEDFLYQSPRRLLSEGPCSPPVSV
jgi:hypothetical protein